MRLSYFVLFFSMLLALMAFKQPIERSEVSEVISTTGNSNCTMKVFEADAALGKLRNKQSKTRSLSETIDEYVAGMKAIDLEECPEPFKEAFRSHIVAWDQMTQVTDHYPELRGEMHELFEQLKESEHAAEFKRLYAEIWDTWEAVEAAME